MTVVHIAYILFYHNFVFIALFMLYIIFNNVLLYCTCMLFIFTFCVIYLHFFFLQRKHTHIYIQTNSVVLQYAEVSCIIYTLNRKSGLVCLSCHHLGKGLDRDCPRQLEIISPGGV